MGDKKAVRGALDTLAEVLWRKVMDRRVVEHELDAAFERAEQAATGFGAMDGPLHTILCELGESALDCAEALDELVERGDLDLAERVAALFAILSPDDGKVERARIRAHRLKPRAGLKQLEAIVGDPERTRSSRVLAMQSLADLRAFDRLGRCAPELLREAIESEDRAWMYQVAGSLHDAFFFIDEEDAANEELARLGRTAGAIQ